MSNLSTNTGKRIESSSDQQPLPATIQLEATVMRYEGFDTPVIVRVGGKDGRLVRVFSEELVPLGLAYSGAHFFCVIKDGKVTDIVPDTQKNDASRKEVKELFREVEKEGLV
jgi:hypothetical protein